ncbi:hypothetical protein J5N97_008180 [Dioscorea zingiberensis]|uniref:F-box protein GID2 n=1 Tax=Dioscorea zingiberensis TaxID=325984 RepID=A0A9D5HVF1_9LILI|nr:hypothetical protein J5N97_008180 [Dioscorea zingiberensis]
MKRGSIEEMGEGSAKKARIEEVEVPVPELGDDLVFEVLKRADATTLAAAACVSRRWRAVTEDERIWEAVCTRQWANFGCGNQQLRSVVLALGGFRQLHSLYLLPLQKTQQHPAMPSSSAAAARRAWMAPARFGKDEGKTRLMRMPLHCDIDQWVTIFNGHDTSTFGVSSPKK